MEPPTTTSLEWTVRRSADGLRTRYRPACRINHTFFSVAPWLDVLLLGICVTLALTSRTLVPGVAVELPTAAFRTGLYSDLVLVVNPLASGTASARNGTPALDVMVFFNDDRFNLSADRQYLRLQESVADHLERVGPRDALLYVDRRVDHGDVMSLVTLLRHVGVRRASIAIKTP